MTGTFWDLNILNSHDLMFSIEQSYFDRYLLLHLMRDDGNQNEPVWGDTTVRKKGQEPSEKVTPRPPAID